MIRLYVLFITILACAVSIFAQIPRNDQATRVTAKSLLDVKIDRFDITDAILRDGISELSLKNVDSLHLGFEEIIRNKIQDDPRGESSHFTLHIQDKSVREVLDELCRSDARYTWSEDGATINVYPRATTADSSYLLNLQIDKMVLTNIPDPNQALTPLSKRFPEQQVGYAGPSLGDYTYTLPWTTVLENLTVRQFINRIAEHMGKHTSWVWQGSLQERMFTFLQGGFHASARE